MKYSFYEWECPACHEYNEVDALPKAIALMVCGLCKTLIFAMDVVFIEELKDFDADGD